MLLLSSPQQPLVADLLGDESVCARIRAEFHEMPGLTLTLPQAARLFSIDIARCERMLNALVDDGCLVTNGRTFASAHGGCR
jgi:hypothetical protein